MLLQKVFGTLETCPFGQLPFPYSTLQVILSELVFCKRKVHPFCFIFHHFALWVSPLRYFSQMGIYLHIFFFILRSEKMSKRKGCSNQLSDKRIKAMSNAKLDSHIKNELRGNNGAMMKIIKVQKDIFRDQEFSLNDYQSIVDRQDEIILHLEEANEETLAANRNLRVRVLELENLQKASDQKINSLEDCNLFLQIKINQLKSALNEGVSNNSFPSQNLSDK